MYGVHLGEMDGVTRETIIELALCADKYNIQPLVDEVCERLTPTSVEGIFPVLRCFMNIKCKSLLSFITSVIQHQTDKLVSSEEFLTLEPDHLEFIAKQDHLSISELELWQKLVHWAGAQDQSEVSLRELLSKPLRHVRLATLTRDEVIDHVLPLNILSPLEFINLLKGNVDVDFFAAGLCDIVNKRGLLNNFLKFEIHQFTGYIFKRLSENHSSSVLSVKTMNRCVQIESFTFRSSLSNCKEGFDGQVGVFKVQKNGFKIKLCNINVAKPIAHDVDIMFPVRKNCQPNSLYEFILDFIPPQPVYKITNRAHEEVKTSCEWSDHKNIQIKYFGPLHHVKQIVYQIN